MKKIKFHKNNDTLDFFPKALLVACFALILIFPSSSLEGAKQGLLLWFHTVIPTLLPFMILSGLIIRLKITNYLSKLLYPLFHTLFGVSLYGCYPILIGFLSGIPVGAKSVADLVKEGSITSSEGQFLLSFSNNASPMFIMSFIAISQLNRGDLKFILLITIYLSAIAAAMLYFRFLLLGNSFFLLSKVRNQSIEEAPAIKFNFSLLDASIMDGFEVITKVGGYIILFSIPAKIMTDFITGDNIPLLASIGLIEITTGISAIAQANIDTNIKIVLITVLTAFGGLSGLAQTKSVIQGTRLSVKTYVKVKLLQVFIAFLIIYIYVQVFSR